MNTGYWLNHLTDEQNLGRKEEKGAAMPSENSREARSQAKDIPAYQDAKASLRWQTGGNE